MGSLGSFRGAEVFSIGLNKVLGHPNRSPRKPSDVSFPLCYSKLQRHSKRGSQGRQGSSIFVYGGWIKETALTRAFGGLPGTDTRVFAGQEDAAKERTEISEPAADYRNESAFFSDELKQAVEAIKERSLHLKSSETSYLGQNEANTFEGGEAGHRFDSSSDTEDETEASVSDARDVYENVKTRLPLESNGPPMAILQPYLTPSSPDDVQENGRRKLRRLPLIVPHTMRPLEIPSPSRPSRFRSIPSRRQKPVDGANSLDLTSLTAEIQALPADTPVSRVLEKFVWRLKKGRLARIIREIGRMHFTGRILEIVSWLQKYPHLWPDHTTLRTAIQVLVDAGEADYAVTLWKEAASDAHGAAEALLSSLVKAGKLVEAVNLADDMKQTGLKMDETVQISLILWACRAGDRQMLESSLMDANLWELDLKLKDYTTLVASCSRLGLVENVENVYKQFKLSGLRPDVVFFSVLLSAYARARKYREAVALFADFTEAGCMPTFYGYKILLDSCSELGDMELGVKVLRTLRGAGLEPSAGFHDSFIHAYDKLGSVPTTEKLQREMQATGYISADGTFAL